MMRNVDYERRIADLEQKIRALSNIKGSGGARVHVGPGGIIVSASKKTGESRQQAVTTLYGKITANDPAYTFAEVTYTGDPPTWTLKTGGITGTALNLDEIGNTTPILVAVDSIVQMLTVTAGGTKYYFFSRQDFSDGTEVEIGTTFETEDTDAWDRDTDDTPFKVYLPSGRPEYDATDHKLYQRMRLCHVDRGGHLKLIDAETARLEITTAVPGVAAE